MLDLDPLEDALLEYNMEAPWPGLEPAVLGFLQSIFPTTRNLQAAFETVDDCCELVASKFPDMIDEDLRNIAASLIAWKEDHSRSFKRARTAAVEKALIHLPGGKPIDLHESYSNISKTSCVMLLEAHLKKRQKSYKAEVGDARAKRFELEKKKYSLLFSNFFKEAKLPIVDHISVLGNVETAWYHLFAARRGNTLKNRYKAWKPFRDWLEVNRARTFPLGVKDAIDYMESRIEDGCGKTVPESFSVALHFVETLGRVPEVDRISGDELWKNHVKSWTAELAQDAPPRKPAEMFTVAMIISLELVVVDESSPSFIRCLSWVVLCMVWASLRCDDVQSILPHRLMLSNFGLRMVLAKTKTTGHDKAQKEVQAFVHRLASLTGADWLGVGFSLWSEPPYNFKRDFLVMEPAGNFDGPKKRFMTVENLSSYIKMLLGQLKVPRRTAAGWELVPTLLLLPDGLESHFSGHSARNFMTSVAAVLGYGRDARAYLGRWAMGMTSSEEYVRTSRQVVLGIQRAVNKSIVEGRDVEYFEDEAIEALAKTAEDHGFNPLRIKRRHICMNNFTGKNSLGGTYPALSLEIEGIEEWQEIPDDPEDLLVITETAGASANMGTSYDESAYKFFVTVSRRQGMRRLHLEGCFVKPSRCSEVRYSNEVGAEDFDSICRSCKKKMLSEGGKDTPEESSSTASSSSTESSGPEQTLSELDLAR